MYEYYMLHIPVSISQLLSILTGKKCTKYSFEKPFLGINSYKDARFCFEILKTSFKKKVCFDNFWRSHPSPSPCSKQS